MGKRNREILRLAEGELEILQMLWQEPAVTILAAHKALALPIGYTAVQTRLNRLVPKGFVIKESARPGPYWALITPEQVRIKNLDTLADRVTEGRVAPLVAHRVNRKDVSAAELRERKTLIQEAQSRHQKNQQRET